MRNMLRGKVQYQLNYSSSEQLDILKYVKNSVKLFICFFNCFSNLVLQILVLFSEKVRKVTIFTNYFKTFIMIQRVQSLYLILVLLLSLLCFFGSILHFTDESGNAVKLMVNGSLTARNGQAAGQVVNIWPITAILIMISLLSLIAIFLFKNRKIQLIMAVCVILISGGLSNE